MAGSERVGAMLCAGARVVDGTFLGGALEFASVMRSALQRRAASVLQVQNVLEVFTRVLVKVVALNVLSVFPSRIGAHNQKMYWWKLKGPRGATIERVRTE